ncbi:hypothetical protein ACFQU7_03985 [Pseudoroseomonas wenyumeiae]
MDGGVALQADRGRLLILTPKAARRHLGDALPPLPADGRDAMVGLVLRTSSLAQARAALQAGGVPVREEAGRLLVSAKDSFGLALGFVE